MPLHGMENREREIALPVAALVALRQMLDSETGVSAAEHIMEEAGHRSGEALYESFAGSLPDQPDALPESSFWEYLSRFFASRGWGTLQLERPHPGVGLLRSTDWIDEAGRDQRGSRRGFSAAVLSRLLTQVAGESVIVLDVTGRPGVRDGCAFAFGTAATLQQVGAMLESGLPFDSLLEEL